MADGSFSLIPPGTPIAVGARRIRVADLFCGAGGFSTGASRAITSLGHSLDLVGVNHWPVAIETNKRNHPAHAEQIHCADLETVRPLEKVPGGALDLLMAAPSCVFHSRARGGRPVNDQQRMDPWHVVRWCTELRVKRLLIENVPEFVDWGPCSLVTGRPIPSRKGEYFRAWLAALKAIGFRRIEYRTLCAADYGDPTTRRRFILIATSDGRRLRWPEPTHAEHGVADLLGSRNRWRAAAEIIDWNLRGSSIFTRRKPLAEKTLRRILAGADRYGWPQPYLDALQALIDGREPVLVVPAASLVPRPGARPGGLVMATASGAAARPTTEPVPTIVGGGNGARPHFFTPLLMGVHGEAAARPTDRPTMAITTGGGSSTRRPGNARPQLIEPIIVNRCNGERGRTATPASEPAPTATGRGAGYLAEPLVAPYYGGGSGLTASPASKALPAITTKGRFGLAEAVMIQTDQTGSAGWIRGAETAPIGTVVSKQNTGLAEPAVVSVECDRGDVRIDINYRMLIWRELARAMSFDDEGEIYDFAGNSTEITKQIGNAVPCRLAKALVRALLEDLA
ncbi:hypothetical protein A7A76_20010 [Lysobacter enzymogenes]|uniref:DNA cytosine methyltransferase n=1 Tax=Lysobacter enzymogenes TaxID=69 RepID=UPI001F155F44|nr:DNA cytosine methyltransferase [Lysobacter enzymogenes]MBN7137026.1 hypothetical protein [Lysobacter enzymogenes]